MTTVRTAVIAGDGIGSDVIAEGRKVLDGAAAVHGGLRFDYVEFPWSCRYYLKHGKMMPDDALSTLSDFQVIYLGACGWSGVPDHVSLWGLLLPIRRGFHQYINLRPVKLLRGIESPLKGKGQADIDFVCVRENTEGEYSNSGGRVQAGTPYEVVVQNNVFTRMGTERVIRYAFELADRSRRRRLTSATKSNGISHSMPFWDEVFREVGGAFPQVSAQLVHIDALTAFFVLKPESFDVVVGSNLFGDILTDLGAAIAGGIGIAPSGNIDPTGKYPSLFEPVHGSAPDIAGKGIANPVGAIWSAAMMLDHLGQGDLAHLVMEAMQDVLEEGRVRTPDLGGRSTTSEMGDAIAARVRNR